MEILLLIVVVGVVVANRDRIADAFRGNQDSSAATPQAASATPTRTSVRRTMGEYDQTYWIMREFLDAAGDRTEAEDFAQAMVNADAFVLDLAQPDRRHLLAWIDDYMLTPPRVQRFGETRDNGAERFRAWLKENS